MLRDWQESPLQLIELSEKLNEIAQAIDRVDSNMLRKMVLDPQDCALQMQRETIEQLRRASRHVPESPKHAD